MNSKTQKQQIGGAVRTVAPLPVTNSNSELLTDESAAAYIGGIASRTVREWRMKRGLGFLRITPKVIRIRKSDLEKFLARHAVSITRGVA